MLPNFLIAGVAKAGTTSLYYYLNQHPEVNIPRKESFYFAKKFYKDAPGDNPPFFRDKSRIIFSEDDYNKFYSECAKKAIGEVSTCYAYLHESAIPLIKEKLGDIKIIFILRNPVERAFSAYKHFIRTNAETLSFKDALEEEKSRIKMKWDFMWYYADVGFYAKQVKAFKENFSQVKIFLAEDLDSNPLLVMQELFQFIGVDDRFIPDTSFRYNESGTVTVFSSKKTSPISILISVIKIIISEKKRMKLRQKLRTKTRTTPLSMDADVKTYLQNLYQDDIIELEKIIERDLNGWKK